MTCCAACTCVWTSWVLHTWGWSLVLARRCWWKQLLKQLVKSVGHIDAQLFLCTQTLSCAFSDWPLIPPISANYRLRQLLFSVWLSFPGRQLDKIKAEAQEKGDLGLVAESSRSNQRTMFQPASLTAGGVFRKLKEIASMSGNSVSQRITFSLGENSLGQIFCYISSVSALSHQ